LIFNFVFGRAFALLANPDNVTTGIFFLGLVWAMIAPNLLLSGVIALGDCVVAGLLIPPARIEVIDVFVLFMFFRLTFCGLILFCVKSISPTLSVAFLEFDGFFICIVYDSFTY